MSRKFPENFQEISRKCPGPVRKMSGNFKYNKCPVRDKCPDHLRHGDHEGTHPVLMEKLVRADNGLVWVEVCREFLRGCLKAEPQAVRSGRGLALLVLCDFGKHRSPAAMALLMYCMWAARWEVDGSYELLSRSRLQAHK